MQTFTRKFTLLLFKKNPSFVFMTLSFSIFVFFFFFHSFLFFFPWYLFLVIRDHFLDYSICSFSLLSSGVRDQGVFPRGGKINKKKGRSKAKKKFYKRQCDGKWLTAPPQTCFQVFFRIFRTLHFPFSFFFCSSRSWEMSF